MEYPFPPIEEGGGHRQAVEMAVMGMTGHDPECWLGLIFGVLNQSLWTAEDCRLFIQSLAAIPGSESNTAAQTAIAIAERALIATRRLH